MSSDLTLIRAGHTEVAAGQCGLCDVPWPCDTGVVLAVLAAAEARVEQAERERDEALVLTGGRVNDAARLVDELTTLLYCPFGTYRGRQQVACGACAKQADKPESVVHESDCPVYRLQQAEAANDAIIKANAEDIADLEDARDAADARANAEWARAEGEQLRADVAALRADRAERFAALWKWAAKVERDRAEQAERESQRLLRLNAAVAGENARLRARLATVEAAADPIIRYLLAVIESADCQGYVPPGYERSDILQAVNDVLLRQSDIELFRAALAATPAAGEVQP